MGTGISTSNMIVNRDFKLLEGGLGRLAGPAAALGVFFFSHRV